MSTPTHPTPRQVTQARHPVRAVLRTTVALIVGLAPMAPLIYEAATNHSPEGATGAAAGTLAIAGAVTRVLALPGVEALLRRHKATSWLAAAPPASQ